jgi:hypothetical protein
MPIPFRFMYDVRAAKAQAHVSRACVAASPRAKYRPDFISLRQQYFHHAASTAAPVSKPPRHFKDRRRRAGESTGMGPDGLWQRRCWRNTCRWAFQHGPYQCRQPDDDRSRAKVHQRSVAVLHLPKGAGRAHADGLAFLNMVRLAEARHVGQDAGCYGLGLHLRPGRCAHHRQSGDPHESGHRFHFRPSTAPWGCAVSPMPPRIRLNSDRKLARIVSAAGPTSRS